jgi:DNA mismatch repair protein MutS
MRIDSETLADLEILASTGGAPGVLGHLDRTRTRGGRDVLSRRLTQPLGSADEIEAVQSALRYLIAHPAALTELPEEPEIVALQRYLASRYTTLTHLRGPALWFESALVRWRHADLFTEVRTGLAALARALGRMRSLAITLGDAPGPIGLMAGELWQLLETRQISELRDALVARHGWRRTLVLDQSAREGAAPAIVRIISIVHELDALRSMARATVEKGYVFPELVHGVAQIDVDGLYHPFIDNAVPNSLWLSERERVVFVTGPNMAGKTTYLKATGVAVLLAHTGMGVPAKSCRISLVDRLLTALRVQDSLRDGVSYFQAEARRMRTVAEALAQTPHCLVVVDEPFRGTNVKDAGDASLTVLSAFARVEGSWFLVASHLIELATELETLPGVVLRHFEATLEDDAVFFDYLVRAGVSDQRLGMKVLEREGVLDALARIGTGSVTSTSA